MTWTEFTNGTTADADEVNANFDIALNNTKQDQTGGSIYNSTAESKIGEVIFPANKTINGILVIATGYTRGYTDSASSHTVKLYSGTNSAFASNTQRKSITSISNQRAYDTWTITYLLTSEETWTGNVYIQITGQNGDANNNTMVVCDSVVVIGIGDAV